MESHSDQLDENFTENDERIRLPNKFDLASINDLNQKYLDFYNAIRKGYFKINDAFTILDVNKIGSKIFNINKENLLNNSFVRYIVPDFHDSFIEGCENAKKYNKMQQVNFMIFRRKGSIIPFKCYINSLFDPESEKNFFLLLLKKNNFNKRSNHVSNRDLVPSSSYTNEAEHLLSIISHELNHPFGVIYNYLNGSVRKLESGNYSMSEIIDGIKIASHQLKRLSEIVLRMKNYNTRKSLNFESVKINEFILETLFLIQKEANESKVAIKCNLDKSYPEFKIDKPQLQQAILHIIRNSIEAMRDAKTDDPKINIEISLLKRNMLEVSISDNGPGISPEYIDQLFNPYFTTKSYGVGLGLSISQNIIEAHGGKLYVEQNSMIGTCFIFNFISQN